MQRKSLIIQLLQTKVYKEQWDCISIKHTKKLALEKTQTDGYHMLLLGYARSPFRDFENFLRIVVGLDEDDIHVVGLDEDDIQLILKQYNSKSITYEIPPGLYPTKDISQTIYTRGDH